MFQRKKSLKLSQYIEQLYIAYMDVKGVDRLREVISKKIPKFLVYSDHNSDSFDKEAGWESEPGEWVGKEFSC